MAGKFRYAKFGMNKDLQNSAIIVADELSGKLDVFGFPGTNDWDLAKPVRFASDWQGKNEDIGRETEVRALWTTNMLFLKFSCRYRTITVFNDGDPNGRRDQLWDRDVAEVFLQPDPEQLRRYWEFEVSPNGMWIDLEISPGGRRDPESGMKSRVILDENKKLWTAMLAFPMQVLTKRFDPSAEWRVNFFRVEGVAEPRFYSSWQPTHTPQPNFHVPEAFGVLCFQKSRERSAARAKKDRLAGVED
jgi:alpha-galactosidase